MRIRSIKPEFWNHPVLGRLPDSLQLLALGLLSYADDEGLFLADPKLINAALRALRPHRNLPEMLAALQNVQWIEQRSHVEMGLLGKVCAFSAHQRIDRPKPSTLKDYWFQAGGDGNSTIDRRSIAAGRAGQGREGQGSSTLVGNPPKDLFPETVTPPAPKEDKPPKELSDHEVLFSDFQRRRRDRLVELELPPDDEPMSPAFINATGIRWKKWFLANEPGLEEYSDRMSTLLVGLVADYLALAWPADKLPPYPFKMIASEKVWLPIAQALVIQEAA